MVAVRHLPAVRRAADGAARDLAAGPAAAVSKPRSWTITYRDGAAGRCGYGDRGATVEAGRTPSRNGSLGGVRTL